LILRLRAMFAIAVMLARLMLARLMFAWLMLLAWLIGLPLALLLLALNKGLLLLRHEAGLLAEIGVALAVVLAVIVGYFIVRAWLLLRLILPELLLGCGDQPEVMFGMLIVVLGRNRIA